MISRLYKLNLRALRRVYRANAAAFAASPKSLYIKRAAAMAASTTNTHASTSEFYTICRRTAAEKQIVNVFRVLSNRI